MDVNVSKTRMYRAVPLELKTMLPVIRKAFDEKTMQMFTQPDEEGPRLCKYAGPCAIGVCLTKSQQKRFDNSWRPDSSLAIRTLFQYDWAMADENEKNDIVRLQKGHDNSIGVCDNDRKKAIADFGLLLYTLEKQYLSPKETPCPVLSS